MSPMQLTEHFTLDELSVTSHRDIDNTPPAELMPKLQVTARGLEHVRLVLGVPLIVLSGHRCPALNCMVGGAMTRESLTTLIGTRAKDDPVAAYALERLGRGLFQFDDSQHMKGEAGDFIAPRFGSPFDICRSLEASDVRFDQLIFEGTWVHVSFIDAKVPRREILTWKKGRGYTPGLSA